MPALYCAKAKLQGSTDDWTDFCAWSGVFAGIFKLCQKRKLGAFRRYKRRVGFTEYCMEHDISCNSVEMSEKQIVSVYESYGSRKLINNMLRAYISPSMGEHSIDGIFTSSDHLAMIVQEELEEMGKRVPEDIQIIGYDGLQFLNQGKPIVSSIAQPVHEIAKQAVKSLTELIEKGKAEDVTNIPVTFHEGPTTKPLETISE